jgi:hypothetical protein
MPHRKKNRPGRLQAPERPTMNTRIEHDSPDHDRSQDDDLGSCPQPGKDDELESVYAQLTLAQAEIFELKRALRDCAARLQLLCDHFSHAFPPDGDTRKFIARIWLKSKSD